MRTFTMLVSAAVLGLALVAARNAAPQDGSRGGLSWRLDGDDYVLTVDEQGVAMTDFIAFASHALELPIEYDRKAAAARLLMLEGEVRVARPDLRAFIEAMADTRQFVVTELQCGSATILGFRDMSASFPPRGQSFVPRPVELADLEAWRQRKTVISVVLPLQHHDARRAMGALTAQFDSRIGAVRALEESNALLISERADVVCQGVDLLRIADVPGAPDALVVRYEERLKALEARVAGLEGR